MDDPGLDDALHREALRALRRVNAVSGTTGRIWRAVQAHAAARASSHGSPAPIRLLDVACGGGDTLVELGRRARRSGVALELHGCDVSGTALDQARARAGSAGVQLHLHRVDVMEDELPGGFDVVTCTLFLHHLERPDVVALLRRLAGVARTGVVQDLLRTRLGYVLAWAGLRILSRSPVARVDGPRSVEAGFSLDEMAALVSEAGVPGARIRRVWPERVLLRWGTP